MKFRQSDVGYDVRDVGDRNSTANEQLYTLPIAETGYIDVPDDYSIVTKSHGRGFAPVFWCFARLNDGTTVTMPDFNIGRVYIDASNIIFEPYTDAPGRIYYYLFDWSLTRTLSPINVKTSQNSFVGGGGAAENRTSKPTKNIKTIDVIDENIDTNNKNLLIHSVVSNTMTAPSTVTVNHDLGYRPFVFWYIQFSDNDQWESFDVPIGDVIQSQCLVSDTQIQFYNTISIANRYTAVIFKDQGVV